MDWFVQYYCVTILTGHWIAPLLQIKASESWGFSSAYTRPFVFSLPYVPLRKPLLWAEFKIYLIKLMSSVVSWQGQESATSAHFVFLRSWFLWCSLRLWCGDPQELLFGVPVEHLLFSHSPGGQVEERRETWRLLFSSERSWWEEEKWEVQLRKAARAPADPHSHQSMAISQDVGSWAMECST